MPTPPLTGLSNLSGITGFAGSAGNLARAGRTPEEVYQTYRSESTPVTFLQYPPELPEYRMILVGREYAPSTEVTAVNVERDRNSQSPLLSIAKSGYILPLPQARLSDTYQVNYDDSFSFLGGILRTTVSKILQGLTGLNLNRFKSVLLEAPTLKRHQLLWKFSPKNVSESYTIRKIVNNLKSDMAPTLSGANIVLGYPYIFDVYYDPHFQWMYGYKPSVIESIDVDYAGGNPHPVHYKNGAPESVIMTINLLELEFWVRQDYKNWHNVADNTITTTPVGTLRNTALQNLADTVTGTNPPSEPSQ